MNTFEIDFSNYVTPEDPTDPRDRARLICSRIADDLQAKAEEFAAGLNLKVKLRHHVTGSGQEPIVEKQLYTVVTVSSNTNPFGLKSILLLSETGEGWQVLKSAYGVEPLPAIGDKVERVNGRFALGTYECPRQLSPTLPKSARKILKEISNRKNS